MLASQEQYEDVDVIVVGGGPAGRWLAALLVRRSVSVILVDPRPGRIWPNRYGVFVDEVEGLELPVDLARSWSAPVVRFGTGKGSAGAQQVLGDAYGQIDNSAFQARLDRLVDAGGARRLAAKAKHVKRQGHLAVLTMVDGTTLRARLIVDASGGAAQLADYEAGGSAGFQTAFGLCARVAGDPLKGASMVLMDLEAPFGEGFGDGERPSFLYGMRHGDDTYFLEETVLVGRPAVSVDILRRRLHRRLHACGVVVKERIEEERCQIPMGTALPKRQQQTLAFGAAAGYVHPATGYQLARTLRIGPAVAEVIADGIGRRQSTRLIAERGHEVMWPPSMRRAHRMLCVGMETLLGLDGPEMSQFFERFFSLPKQDWRAYMSGEATPGRLAAIMWRLFRGAPMALQIALGRRALRSHHMLRKALIPGGPAYG